MTFHPLNFQLQQSVLDAGQGLDHLGRIPLEMAVRQGGDAGIPAVAQREEGPAAVALKELAGQVAARLAVRAANETAPTLTVA